MPAPTPLRPRAAPSRALTGWAHIVMLCVGALLVVLGVPSRAAAHGASGDDATNYRIDVTDPGRPGLRWRVHGDSQIELTNETGADVVVAGYRDEPYLRFAAAGGVYVNRRSPATYLNADRYGDVEVPADVDPTASPDWQPVAGGSRYAWHDHRIHWMSPAPPPVVAANRSSEHLVFSWVLPVTVGGAPADAHGDLWWIPPVQWWPPVVGTALIFLAVIALASHRSSPDAGRWRGLGRCTAVLVWIVLAANAVRTVDDMLAVPATASEQAWIAGIAAVTIAAVAALTIPTWQGRPIGFGAAAAAGLATMLTFGGESHVQLHRSQLATELPAWVRRWTVGASFTVLAATSLAAVLAGRWYARQVAADNMRR